LSSGDLPKPVHNFLLEQIDSLEQLEALLLMRRDRKAWTPEQVAAELRIQPESARARIQSLAERGILVEEAGAYRYSPREGATDLAISQLASAYAERRVTVINFIATKNLERIRSFAAAFKFKGDPK
jgi:hypothetical protein